MSHIVDTALDDLIAKKEKDAAKKALENHKPGGLFPFLFMILIASLLYGYASGSIHNIPVDKTQLDSSKAHVVVEYLPAQKPPKDQTVNSLKKVETTAVEGQIINEKGEPQVIKHNIEQSFNFVGEGNLKVTKDEAQKLLNNSTEQLSTDVSSRKSQGSMFAPKNR
jgi:hypothetical protein